MKRHLIVAPPPEALTGISYFTFRVFGNDQRFKIEFCNDIGDNNKVHRKALAIVASLDQYSTVTLVLGNSEHNILAGLTLQLLKGYTGASTKIFLEIHDPVLNNILYLSEVLAESFNKKSVDISHKDFYRKKLGLDKSKDLSELYMAESIWKLHIDHGIIGARYLAENFPIYGFIFHSQFARDVYLKKLEEINYIMPLMTSLYHPCFDQYKDNDISSRKFSVGVFGVMDNGGKMTNISARIIDAIRKKLPGTKFVFAGYNAKEWAQYYLEDARNCEIINNPSREELFEIMCNTKIALQPRATSSGESSGIVPMLIASKTHTIVSNVGAFTEYNLESILPVENKDYEKGAINIINSILSNREWPDMSKNEEYIKDHSIEAFKSKLYSILSDSSKSTYIRICKNKIVLNKETMDIITETEIIC